MTLAQPQPSPNNPVHDPKAREGESCVSHPLDGERVRCGRQALPQDSQAHDIADTFKALAHPTRVKVLRALTPGELCVCEIAAVVGLSLSAISHQLQKLKAQRIVRSRTEVKLVYYALRDPFIISVLEDCARHVADLHGTSLSGAAEPRLPGGTTP